MAAMTIFPARLCGNIAVPPSKSLAHRALLCASLAAGESTVSPLQPSDDILATIGAMRALGAEIRLDGETAHVRGIQSYCKQPVPIDANESGSTLRFMLPISLAVGAGAVFLARGKLAQRPMAPYEEICRARQIRYEQSADPTRAVCVSGHLSGGEFALPGDISSQFITGLLYALPLLNEDSVITITTPLESSGYIDLTLASLKQAGIVIRCDPAMRRFEIPGRQKYRPGSYHVERDYSQAAVFLTAAALGENVCLTGLNPHSLQGDRAAISILTAMGAHADWQGDALRMRGPLHGTTMDASQCPDIIPMMALACALADGESRILHAGRLRMKECDRLAVTIELIRALGGHIAPLGEDGMQITGVPAFNGGVSLSTHKDHRMAMLLSIAALFCRQPIVLDDPACVCKSYPEYFADYERLGGKTNGQHVG